MSRRGKLIKVCVVLVSQRSPLAKSNDYGFVTPSQMCVTHVHVFNRFGIPGDCDNCVSSVSTSCTYGMTCFSKASRGFVCSSFIKYSRGREVVLYSEMSLSVSVMQRSDKL